MVSNPGRPGGQLADRGDVAVAQPVRGRVGAGAIEHDVGGVDPLLPVRAADEQPERPADVVGVRLLHGGGTTDVRLCGEATGGGRARAVWQCGGVR